MKTTRRTTSAAIGAKELREALKHAFPNIKFSVKSETYAGGDSIRVSYNFGPIQKEVEKIAKRWQGGNFNGMEDIYEYSEPSFHVTPEGAVQEVTTVKYLFVDRKYATAADKNTYKESGKITVAKAVAALYNVDYVENGDTNLYGKWEGVENTANSYAYRLLQDITFPSDTIEVTGVKTKECDSFGLYELSKRFEVEYTDLAAPKKAAKTLSQPVATQTPDKENITAETAEIKMVKYSDKSFVVFGNTKPIKDTLKSLGGRFNSFLTHPETGDKLTGWIFPQTAAEKVINTIF